jgi:hypothetical protein
MHLKIKIRSPRPTRFERSEEGIALADGYVLWQRVCTALGKSDLNTIKREHGKDLPTKQYTTKRVYYNIDAVVKFFGIAGLEEELRTRHKKEHKPWSVSQSKISGRG